MNIKTYFIIGIVVLIIIALQPQEQKTTQLNRIQNPSVATGQVGTGDFDEQKRVLIPPIEPKKQANLPPDINRINSASASVEFGPLVTRLPLSNGGSTGTNKVTNTRILDLAEITSPGEETVALILTLSGQIVNTEKWCIEYTLFRPDGTTKKTDGESCVGIPPNQEWWDWVKFGAVWTGKPYDILTAGQHRIKADIVSGSPVSGSYELFFDVIDTTPVLVCNQGEKACDVYSGSVWTTECRDNSWVRVNPCSEACFLGECLLPDCSILNSAALNSINSWNSNPISSTKSSALNAINRWATSC